MIGVGDVVAYCGPKGKRLPGVTDSGLKIGSVHRVLGVAIHPMGWLGLDVGTGGYVLASSFRKVKPADAGFRFLLASIKPKVSA